VRFRPFSGAREYAHTIKLKNRPEWREYCRSGKKPKNIPYDPKIIYKKEWKGTRDWLGTEFLPFKEAKKYLRSLGFKSRREYEKWAKSGQRPNDIPSQAG
jgi:hypothetical protein